jgi:hypothetical protein
MATYTALARSAIPKRTAPGRTVDLEAANDLLAVLMGAPIDDAAPTATDGATYADAKLARAEANKAKRLVAHVLPDGTVAKSAIFGLDADGEPVLAADGAGSFGWAVWLTEAPAEKPAKSK